MYSAVQPAPAAAPPISIGQLVERAARTRPDHTAVVDENGVLTYRELQETADKLAGAFAHAGIARGDRVGLWIPNMRFWLQSHIALARIGAVVVGINSRYPVNETARILRAAAITTLIIDPGSQGIADESAIRGLADLPGIKLDRIICRSGSILVPAGISCFDADELMQFTGPVPDPVEAYSPCSVFTSSGSTGDPKLILHTHAGITTHSVAVARAFKYDLADTVVLGQLPLCGVWGFNTAYGAIAGMATLVLMQRFDAAKAIDLIAIHGVTNANGPDLFLTQLFTAAASSPEKIRSMREIGFSTFSNDAQELVRLAEEHGVKLFQVYGSSEQQALMLRQPSESDVDRRAIPGGLPSNDDTQLRIRDAETHQLNGLNRPGGLESKGPNLMAGYLTRDGLDTTVFTDDGWLRTGDIGQMTDSGFQYLTRDKDALRLSGFLVDPQEIEILMEELDGVLESKVVGVDTPKGPRCVAFVRMHASVEFEEERLLQTCRTTMASYKVPTRIFAVDDYPRVDGANGPRIQRLALRTMAKERL